MSSTLLIHTLEWGDATQRKGKQTPSDINTDFILYTGRNIFTLIQDIIIYKNQDFFWAQWRLFLMIM